MTGTRTTTDLPHAAGPSPHDFLTAAVRGYMAPLPTAPDNPPPARDQHRPAPTGPVLFLDTETLTDTTQALTFGCYRYCRQHPDGQLVTVAEGLLHADDLPDRDPAGYAALRSYARSHRRDVSRGSDSDPVLQLLTRREFVTQVLWPAAARARATVVGFNLPFDLSRLAVHVGEGRAGNAGGFSLQLWDYNGGDNPFRPRIRIRSLDSKRARITFSKVADDSDGDLTERDGRPFRGNFLDLRTLAFALTNTSHSLASACEAFGVTEGKGQPAEHGVITNAYIDYCRRDVRVTAALYQKLIAAYQQHPIELPVTLAYSPASIAKAYLRTMRIPPPLTAHPDLDPQLLGAAMSAFYGGRAECRIRRTPVPVTVVDFTSMYPTVNALMNTWQLLTATAISTPDVTDEMRQLLATVTVEGCFDPALWPRLVGIALVEPDGDVLPVRARYGSNDEWGTAVNPFYAGPLAHQLWYSLADLVAAALLTGRPPTVLRAVRFQPHGQRTDLHRTALRGQVPVNPATDDFFLQVVEQRARLNATGKPADASTAAFLKVLANSGSYGIFAEVNRTDLPASKRTARTVHGYCRTFTCRPDSSEDPGSFCFPPLVSAITGAARLLLALLERTVTDAGGHWAFADTDSMAIVSTPTGGLVPCPGGPHSLPDGQPAIRALGHRQVEQIRRRFDSLNPYDRTAIPELLKREDTATCFAISAKRYALYTARPDGTVNQLVKTSEHGLGHLLNPADPSSDDRDWIGQAWRWLITSTVAPDRATAVEPAWLVRAAVARTTISSPVTHRPFAGSGGYADSVKPFNFLAVAFPRPLLLPPGIEPRRLRLIAPYERDSGRWTTLAWRNPYRPADGPYQLDTSPDLGHLPAADTIAVKSYRHLLLDYATHPEPKATDQQGGPCHRSTTGLLHRRRTVIAELRHIGKEAHRLDDAQTGVIADSNEITSDIADPDDDQLLTLALAVPQPHSTAQLAQHLPVSERRLRDVRARRSTPHHPARQALITLACHQAHGELATPRGTPTWYDEASCLAAHLTATKDPTFDQSEFMADRCGPSPLPMRLSTRQPKLMSVKRR